ncbi:DUF2304 domain-containing protein [Acutalibacter intestini]|uniref:DUF2304 domain-containing protein n=1 Tax=Acutalibacter intestini TaxID=3093659 RepID=UPI002AC8F5F7|nr:DUF2304 domain-containing protein [Acutalibacter sp. M00204]
MMTIPITLRVTMVVVGILVLGAAFWCLSKRKMTANLTVVWEFLGAAMIIVGAVPVFSRWTAMLSAGTGIAVIGICTVGVLGAFQFALLISKLLMRSDELAVQVSLLLEENRQLALKLEELKKHEEDSIRNQYPEQGRGGDGPVGLAEEAERNAG